MSDQGQKYSIVRRFFGETEKSAVAGHLHFESANEDEIDEDGFSTPLINNRCKLHKLIQGDGFMFFEIMQQEHLGLGKGDFGESGVFLVFPYFEQDGVGYQILVMDPDVDFKNALVVGCLVFFVLVSGNDHLENSLAVDFPFFGGEIHLGLAVHLGSGLDHVNFFLRPNTGNGTVVLDTDQKPAAISVRKSSQRPGNSSAVGNLELEIQLLVLAFFNQLLYVLLRMLHDAKIRKFQQLSACPRKIGESKIKAFLGALRHPFFGVIQPSSSLRKLKIGDFYRNKTSARLKITKITKNL